jgi:sugar O-acyltransferase (sialic acid O-acetyltransferase NeuD family)
MPVISSRKKRILILGTRSLAEELADVISEIRGCEVVGFVENLERERCANRLRGLPVHWVDDLAGLAGSHFAVGGLATTQRKRYVEQVAAMGMRFATLIHPTARISHKAVIGEGCFISPFCSVSAYTTLGEHVFVNRGCLVGHHTNIGSYVTIHPGANIAGMVNIGDGTYVGMGAVILDKVSIGSGSIVGAGAVVTKDVPDRVQVVGVPAKVVRTGVEGK